MNSPASPQAKRHIGQILISQGILTEDQLRIALLEQLKSRQPVGKLLVQLGLRLRGDAAGRPVAKSSACKASTSRKSSSIPARIRIVPREFAKRHNLFPVALDKERKRLILAISDTNNIVALDQVRAQFRGEYEIEVGWQANRRSRARSNSSTATSSRSTASCTRSRPAKIDYQSLQASGDEYCQPVVRLISALLADAVERAASDIHFEPEQNFLRIRYRIDGVLRQIRSLHKTYWPAMAVRIKVMAKMNIAETRAPQDGRISLSLTGRQVDFRVASQVTTHGENIVLRILDRQKGIVPLDQLGLQPEQLAMLKKMIQRPEGIILVTGPTGSGKTTTLYSILNHINHDGINIMTLEDPVEYPMTLIRQTSVNEAAKLDFANGIRSLMRQDPDVILVGEIRDEDTAQMAFRAAMTGHQVYSTLHTNSVASARFRVCSISACLDRDHGRQHHRHRRPAARAQALPSLPAALRRERRRLQAARREAGREAADACTAPSVATTATIRATAGGSRSWSF